MSKPATPQNTENPAHWEQRSMQRVLNVDHDPVLERSRKIVEAAYDLLDEAGLEGLTIRAVLNRTGLSRRAFYERFEGKDDLVLAVFEETIRKAVRLFSEMIASMENPLERLQLIVTFIVLGRGMQGEVSNDRRGAALSREHLRLAESRPADLKVALKPLMALIQQQLEDGMAAGVVRKEDPLRLATLVYNLVSTTVHTELLTSENAPLGQEKKKQLADDIWEFCRRAISV